MTLVHTLGDDVKVFLFGLFILYALDITARVLQGRRR